MVGRIFLSVLCWSVWAGSQIISSAMIIGPFLDKTAWPILVFGLLISMCCTALLEMFWNQIWNGLEVKKEKTDAEGQERA